MTLQPARIALLLALFAPVLPGCDGTVKTDDTGPIGDTDADTDTDTDTDTDSDTDTDTDTDTDVLVADIEVDPLSLDLGATTPGGTLTGTFLVRNVGDAPLAGTLAIGGSTGFYLDSAVVDLAAGGELVVTVGFSAGESGSFADEVYVTTDDPDEALVTVGLRASVSVDADIDADGDGYLESTDCDDTDATVYPGATETWYDGVDSDCDGRSDYDQDQDGYASADHGGADCDDTNAGVSPGDLEVAENGVDDDCDGSVDEALSTEDLDGDGYTEVAGDCNDGDATVNPGATETWYDGLDQDCDGANDWDADADGYESGSYGGDDCADTDAAVNPGATEIWYDGLDQDCDGRDDDQDGDGVLYADDCDDLDASVGAATYWYADVDADGYGDDLGTAVYDCAAPAGHVSLAGDCNDADAAINPLAAETCDGVDQDCDGAVDDDPIDGETFYADVDGDTYGDAAVATTACEEPAGYVYDGTDCDDTDAAINPAATEILASGVDEDCDGRTDEEAVSDASGWTVVGGTDIGATGVWTLDDLDGDGAPELAIAAASDDTAGTGAGALALHDTSGADIAFGAGWYVVTGAAAGDAFASSAAAAGDVDGDGWSSFAVGAPGSDDVAADAGVVYVLDASAGAGAWSVDAVWSGAVTGASASGWFGAAVATGDLDGDGVVDLLVGAPGEGAGSGTVYGFTDGWSDDVAASTAAAASAIGEEGDDALGTAVLSADLDGDGVDEVVLCAPGWDLGSQDETGICYVVTATDLLAAGGDTVVDIDTANIIGDTTADRLGDNANALAAGDLDGDGISDLAIGLPGWDGVTTDGGAVAVVFGGALSGRTQAASAPLLIGGDGALGTSVRIPGDLDGDGLSDLVLGAPTADVGGVTYLVPGGLSGTVTVPGVDWRSWLGGATGDGLGTAVGGGHDLDGDGLLDLALAAPGEDSAGSGAGKVYVVPVE